MGNLHGVGGSPPADLTKQEAARNDQEVIPSRVNFWRAAMASAGLSALFMVVYNGTNWLTSLRTDVGTLYFQWELSIPFVPLMILPYMSIDLFFVAAPFLCSDRRELRTHVLRVSFVILVAGACFLAFPLKLGFERSPVEGWLGWIFNPFLAVDKPFNLLPSLHITLRTILGALYARHTQGLVRVASQFWFSLIGVSTILTHQHHLVDVLGGFVLAAICFYAIPDRHMRTPVTPSRRLAMYYGVGAAIFAGLATLSWPVGIPLLWPALSLAVVMAAYCGLGPGIFRKYEGRLPLASRIVLGPALVGQRLSLCYYARECQPWDEVTPSVWIGRQLNCAEARQAIEQGVTAVLDLSSEFTEAAPLVRVNYHHLPILDLTAPTQAQLQAAARFIHKNSQTGVVYVHCKIGYSRSAAAVGAYLLATGQAADAQSAITLLRQARPTIVVRPEAQQALEQFAADRRPVDLFA